MHLRLFLLLHLSFRFSLETDYDIELVPENCDCRDYYGECRQNSHTWLDDDVWIYSCENSKLKFIGCQAGKNEIRVGGNTTIDQLWHSCEEDETKLKFSIEPFCNFNNSKHKLGDVFRDGDFQWLCLSTGVWITGCYYFNETHSDLLLPVGQSAVSGLIEHVCAKKQEYPAIVQYYTQIVKGVDVKHPTNKGINNNWPRPIQKLVAEDKNVSQSSF
ncbi:unnamed protein product [Caenorhabditis bovis]|uniref:Uncharacterized protein n=1 Tax=Caenorhabditis bovis TaxID=2654633 RepID=A0A8S1EC67_9PELO|nr:unnamed protein product [Caenorhabditis bovis]